MQKISMLVLVVLFLACNNPSDSKETKEAVTTPAEKIDYAYLPDGHDPDNWDRGDQKNIAIVLNSLKAYSSGDVEGALDAFADSVHWSFDYVDEKISKDSLRSMFKEGWTTMASVEIKMGDYESVISKDKKEEWVTVWYKQIMTDKNGKKDSIAVVDDAKIVNGKIVVLDEKTRKFPVPKK